MPGGILTPLMPFNVSTSIVVPKIASVKFITESITIIEWPEIILDLLKNYNYFSVNFDIIDENKRNLKHNFIY